MQWSAYRDSLLRPTLKDTDSNAYIWSNAELLGYANWGLEDLALYFAPLATWTLTGAGPSHMLPADFYELNHITLLGNGRTLALQPFDLYRDRFLDFETPDSSSTAGYLLNWPSDGLFYVTPLQAAGVFTLSYWRAFAELTTDTDVMPFARRGGMSQALTCYIAYCAHLREGVGRAQLEQWAQRPDLLVKNVFNIEAAEWLRAYRLLVSEHRTRGSAR